MGIGNLKACVRGLTKLNVVVVNTHGHPDHAGGNLEFDECYMHPADARWYRQMCTREFRTADVRRILNEPATELCDALLDMAPMPLPIADGTEIDLGGRKVQVIATPRAYGRKHLSAGLPDTGAVCRGQPVRQRSMDV